MLEKALDTILVDPEHLGEERKDQLLSNEEIYSKPAAKHQLLADNNVQAKQIKKMFVSKYDWLIFDSGSTCKNREYILHLEKLL